MTEGPPEQGTVYWHSRTHPHTGQLLEAQLIMELRVEIQHPTRLWTFCESRLLIHWQPIGLRNTQAPV